MSGGSSATGSGLSGTVYTPTNQPQTDTQLQDVMNQFYKVRQGTGDNPPSTYYPYAQTDLGYLAPALGGTASTYAGTALDAANAAISPAYSGLGTASTALSNYYTPYDYLNYSYQPLAGYATTALDTAATLPGYSSQMYSTAFDPQQSRYNQGQAQALDYANVANSMAGTANSPYGANVTANTLSNYDIDWRNQQLKNEMYGAYGGQSLGSTYGGYGTSAGSAYTDIGNLGYGSAYGLQSLGSGYTKAGTDYSTAAYLPYSESAKIGTNAMTGYQDVSNLGLSSYILPQDYANQAQSYLGLGQSASGLANTIGSTNYNQTASTVGGALSGTNALFGTNSLLGGSSGIFGSGGLFGSGTSAAGAAAGYGGDLTIGGGGDLASSLAPATLLGS